MTLRTAQGILEELEEGMAAQARTSLQLTQKAVQGAEERGRLGALQEIYEILVGATTAVITADQLLGPLKEELPPEVEEILPKLHSAARRLREIVEQIRQEFPGLHETQEE